MKVKELIEEFKEWLKEIEKERPTIKVGDIIDGGIVYKIDEEFVYLVAPASKRFKDNWQDAAEKCEAEGYNVPPKEDLQLIYELRKEIDAADSSGGELTLTYFVSNFNYVLSSTKASTYCTWALDFFYESWYHANKGNNGFVVPVRKVRLEDLV